MEHFGPALVWFCESWPLAGFQRRPLELCPIGRRELFSRRATFGLSGVAGVGDLGVAPVQVGVPSGQGVLTNYSPEVNNTSAASVQRQITGKTYIDGSGSLHLLLRFINGAGGSGGYGLESDWLTGSAGFGHRVDARNTFGANYAYSSFIFLNNLSNGIPESNFSSQTASFFYSRQVNRKLGFSVAAGPEWTKINLLGSTQSLNAYADASINYTGEFSHLSLSYVRTTNNGYGVIGGGLSDSGNFSAGRIFARVWNCAASVSYSHMANLPTPGVTSYNHRTRLPECRPRAPSRITSPLTRALRWKTRPMPVPTRRLISSTVYPKS